MGRRALGPNMRFSVRLTDIKPPSSDVRGCLGDGEGFPSLPSSPSPPDLPKWVPQPQHCRKPRCHPHPALAALAVASSGCVQGGVRGSCHITSVSQPWRGDSIKVLRRRTG